MKKLDKKINWYVFASRSVVTLVFLAFFMIVLAVPDSSYDEIAFKYLLIGIAVFLLLLAIIFNVIVPFYTYRLYGYDIKDEEVIIQKGVLFKKTTVIQVKRIQHVEKLQGPIQILFKLATIAIYTAGSVETIMGLNNQQSDEVLGILNSKLNSHLNTVEEEENE